jgi:transcriptional regulator of met regulon
MKPEEIERADAVLGSGNELAWTDPNPRHGEKGCFRKITTTLPQWAYQLLIEESARRKIAREPNQLLSALLREAIADYLKKLRGQPL